MQRNYRFGRLTFSFDLISCCIRLSVHDHVVDRCFSAAIFWNRLLHPTSWWWWHNNGAKKGVDNCYDFTSNFFIFNFNYTNFGLWRYKKTQGEK